MFKNVMVYRVGEGWSPTLEQMEQALSAVFAQQRQAMAHIQEDIKGVAVREVAAAAALISDEELAALLK